MIFNSNIFYKKRKDVLKVSREKFCKMVFNQSDERLNLSVTRLLRLEKEPERTRMTPGELGILFGVLNATPNEFWSKK